MNALNSGNEGIKHSSHAKRTIPIWLLIWKQRHVRSLWRTTPIISKAQPPSSAATAPAKRIASVYTPVIRASFGISKPDDAWGGSWLKAFGLGPPVAQSSSSAVCTTGTPVADPICIMQPRFPADMMSGCVASSAATLRVFNAPEISGCIKL